MENTDEYKLSYIKKYVEDNDRKFIGEKDLTPRSIDKIYDLFVYDESLEPNMRLEYFYYGWYYQMRKKFAKMKLYYKCGIELCQCPWCATNLYAWFFENKQYQKYIKYALKASEFGDRDADWELAGYYATHNDDENYRKQLLHIINVSEDKSEHKIKAIELYSSTLFAAKFEECEKYCKIGIENGSVVSKLHLACLYRERKDYEGMKKILEGVHHPQAYTTLGIHYQNVEKDRALMEENFKKGAEMGSQVCMVALGLRYKQLGQYKDAEVYLTKAFEKGLVKAGLELAMMYWENLEDITLTKETLERLVQPHKSLEAMRLLGVFYETEEKDENWMEFYYKLALDQKSSDDKDIRKQENKIKRECATALSCYYEKVKKDSKLASHYKSIWLDLVREDTDLYSFSNDGVYGKQAMDIIKNFIGRI